MPGWGGRPQSIKASLVKCSHNIRIKSLYWSGPAGVLAMLLGVPRLIVLCVCYIAILHATRYLLLPYSTTYRTTYYLLLPTTSLLNYGTLSFFLFLPSLSLSFSVHTLPYTRLGQARIRYNTLSLLFFASDPARPTQSRPLFLPLISFIDSLNSHLSIDERLQPSAQFSSCLVAALVVQNRHLLIHFQLLSFSPS